VLLTGSTGYVGAFLLAELLEKTQAQVHCLIRARDEREALRRVRQRLEAYDLWSEALAPRIRVVLGDLSRERFGLNAPAFERLARSIDVIFHNGAWVDQVRSYRTLKAANVLGTHEVLRLACSARLKPVHFISTLNSIHPDRATASGVIREDAPPGPLELLLNGYMQSKCVAESLVLLARDRGVPTAIYRLGAVMGHSRTGVCNPDDYTYSVLRAAVQLGIADDLNPDMLVTPVDFVARAIVALSRRPESHSQVFNVTNPRPLFWLDLIQALRDRGYSLRVVSYAETVDALSDATRRGIDYPASVFLPLFRQKAPQSSRYLYEDYYKHVTYDCTNTLRGLAGTGIVCTPPDQLIDVYLAYLRSKGWIGSPSSSSGRRGSPTPP
jgi:thioester reductase-like protein